MDALKEPKEEPVFGSEIADSVVNLKIKEEEISDDGMMKVKEEEMEAETPIVDKKKKVIHQKAKDSRVANEGENRRRSSRNVARPTNYAESKKSRLAANKSGDSESTVTNDGGEEVDNDIKTEADDMAICKKEEDELNAQISEKDAEMEDELTTKVKEQQPAVINQCKCAGTQVLQYANPSKLSISAKFIEISKLIKDSKVLSNTTEFRGITWTMNMQDSMDGGRTFNLEAESKNTEEFLCFVASDLHVYSQPEGAVLKITRKNIFDGETSSGNVGSLSFKDLFDEGKGLVIKDDSLVAVVVFKIYPRSMKQAKGVPIRAKFVDISKLTEEEIHSQPSFVDGMMWNMSVKKDKYDQFSFILKGEKKTDASFWCPVIAELGLISQKTGKCIHIDTKKYIYEAGPESECLGTISFKDLFDDENGFVKNDSIIVDVVIKAFRIY